MRNLLLVFAIALIGSVSNFANAQSVAKTIKLEQTPGEFTVKGLTLTEGKYFFEISNKGVDHQVGFIITPKGQEDMEHAVKGCFIQNGGKGLEAGESATTEEVTLKKGEYVYWCPMNPTDKNYITVK